jgi:hypothetical protein
MTEPLSPRIVPVMDPPATCAFVSDGANEAKAINAMPRIVAFLKPVDQGLNRGLFEFVRWLTVNVLVPSLNSLTACEISEVDFQTPRVAPITFLLEIRIKIIFEIRRALRASNVMHITLNVSLKRGEDVCVPFLNQL